ncbi:MAG: type II toxin-antitoxin system RelE/ParE family toxin [Verrucomicrobia bacterium]|nr:type II toxin-antitoxin system RelE/ParE family toxin [Verrucomicrobiota bacterium]
MIFKVTTEVEAERDWSEAVDWYEQRESGIGSRLNTEVHSVLQTLARQPGRFPLVGRMTRRIRISGWPYSVFFTINEEHREVKVIAIWHGARNPGELKRRLS